MNIFSRILVTVYAICFIIISLVVMSISVRPTFLDEITGYVYNIMSYPYINLLIFIIAFIFLASSLVFLFSGLRKYRGKKAVRRFTNIGEVRISLETIDNIALAVTRKITGIKETKAYSYKTDESLSIELKVVLFPEVNIPSLSEDVQTKVKKSVEATTGIEVDNVSVIIENVYSGLKSKVVE